MPRCLKCNDKFVKKHKNQMGKFSYCLNRDDCITEFWQKVRDKRIAVDTKERKANLETVQELMKKAQKVFNEFIRLRDKGLDCISCCKPCKKENAGHYFSSGGHKNVTFNEDNVHLQCEYCNTFLHGNLINYQVEIEKRIGGERLLKLHEEAHKDYKPTREELRQLMKHYKEKISELKKND